MKILFWDIDGTLLKTAKAGLYAFEQAAAEMYQAKFDLKLIPTAGMTDCFIAKKIVQLVTGHEPTAPEITEFILCYEKLLPAHLAARQGQLMPSVLETLEFFHHKPDFISLLLTGNTGSGARAKLKHYGIAKYFDFELSAFGISCDSRLDLAAQGLKNIKHRFPAIRPQDIFVIGDTPNDIRCGKFIQAHTIAVATGVYPLTELQELSPWWAIEKLPTPSQFEDKLRQAHSLQTEV